MRNFFLIVVTMDFSNKSENDNRPLSDEVLEILESQFNKVKTFHSTDLEIIAAELGVRDIDVKVKNDFILFNINYLKIKKNTFQNIKNKLSLLL